MVLDKTEDVGCLSRGVGFDRPCSEYQGYGQGHELEIYVITSCTVKAQMLFCVTAARVAVLVFWARY